MERINLRRNSASSIHSQSNSSIANFQCSEEHTHAIIQREKDNKIIMLPLDCFINFGKTVKANEIATYKANKDSRKSDRGKVLLFGTEELCIEQLQVLQEDIVENDQSPEKITNKTNSLLTAISNNSNCEKHATHLKNKLNNQVKQSNKENCLTNSSTTTKQLPKINEIDDQLIAIPSKKINTASSITIGSSTRCEKTASHVKRKLFTEDFEILSTNESDLQKVGSTEGQGSLTKKKFKKVVNSSSSGKTTTPTKGGTNKIVRKNVASSAPSEEPLNESDHEIFDKEDPSSDGESSASEVDDDQGESGFVLSEKYTRLKKRLQTKKNEIMRLKKKLIYMRKNYVPLPDIRARAWFIRVARRFNTRLTTTDIERCVKLIGNIDAAVLLSCLRDRGTETARKIIHALYTKQELLKKTGPQAVSKQRREAIREFVELHNGALPDHQFNESINGVFRQAKPKKQKGQISTNETNSKKYKKDGQLTIDKMNWSKKRSPSGGNTATLKSKHMESSDENDDDCL